MTEKTVYVCEICKNEEYDKECILRCESSHVKPQEIIDFRYRYRSIDPDYIKVKMSDGSVVEYSKQNKKPRRYTTTPEHGNKLKQQLIAESIITFFSVIGKNKCSEMEENFMKEERNFKEVIHAIKGAEKDKDKFCRAARIERQPMSFERYQFTLYFIAGMAAMVMGFVALYMIIYFAGR